MPAPGATGATVNFTMKGIPATEGSGLSLVMVVLVSALLTTWVRVAEVLVLKLVSPPYSAVIEWLPTDRLEVLKLAWPLDRVPVPRVVLPSLKVTVPLAVPAPG